MEENTENAKNNEQPKNSLIDKEDNDKKNRRAVIILSFLLVVLLGFIAYMYFNSKNELANVNENLVKSENLRDSLENQLTSVETQMADYKGQNAQLDSIIDSKKKDLEDQANQIRKLLAKNRITTGQYQKAEKDLEVYRYYVKKYTTQIDSLFQANKALKAENQGLKNQVTEKKRKIDKLADANVRLTNKNYLGAMLKADNLDVTGVKLKGENREKETNRLKHMDGLRVCFDIEQNLIADEGYRYVYLKIVNSEGVTVHSDDMKSGQFKYENKTSLYTIKKQIYYNNKKQHYCIYFNYVSTLKEGTYQVEIYTGDYKLGSQELTLK